MSQESGFEHDGRFYPWNLTDQAKDLLLVDRITGMSPPEFFAAAKDEHETQRWPIQMALIATSLRAGNPLWSVDKILRIVNGLSYAEFGESIVEGEDEEDEKPEGDAGPPDGSSAANESNDGASPQPASKPKRSPATKSVT